MWSAASEVDKTPLDVAHPAPPLPLSQLKLGQRARVRELRLPSPSHGHGEQLVLRLLEIGFVPGEAVRVMALGPGGREPLAVRVGGTMFALRRHEAEHVLVDLLDEGQ